MTIEECAGHIGARVTMTERTGTLVDAGNWAAYVLFDGSDEPNSVAPRHLRLAADRAAASTEEQR